MAAALFNKLADPAKAHAISARTSHAAEFIPRSWRFLSESGIAASGGPDG